MSVRIMADVWCTALPMVQKMVLLALADNANDAGVCWPSIETLMRKCSLSERGVQQAIRQLLADGYLTKEAGGGRGHTNKYTVNPAPQTVFKKPRMRNGVSGALNPAPRAPETPHHVHPEPSIEPSRTINPMSGSSPDVTNPDGWDFRSDPPKGQEARFVLAFLNKATGKRFQAVDANLDLIRARLKEGVGVAAMRRVIVHKADQWRDDDKMREYLRPATLFNRTKFHQYAGELPAQEAA